MKLYSDGWYFRKQDALESFELILSMGGTPLALLEWPEGPQAWGIAYASEECLFVNHKLDWTGAIFAELRRARPELFSRREAIPAVSR